MPEDRHLTVAGVKKYLGDGTRGMIQVPGNPDGYLVIDPILNQLSIQLPHQGAAADLTGFEHLSSAVVTRDGGEWDQLTVAINRALPDTYPLLCSVLDRVQLEGQSFSEATIEMIQVYRDLIAARGGLSESQEIGLIGELLVLRHLIGMKGAKIGMDSWLGPLTEEHDFGLPEFDMDVKTTSSEHRHHWISSADQLVASPGRQIFVLSIQITRAGAAQGHRLPTLIADVRQAAPGQRQPFDANLKRLGWDDSTADLYTDVWKLRSDPLLYEVDDGFPALTPDRLANAVPRPELVLEYRYRVDLDNLNPCPSPEILAGFGS